MGARTAMWLLLATMAATQMVQVQPSNNSADIPNPATSPRFLINSTGSVQFPGFQAATLGSYVSMSYTKFLSIRFEKVLVNTGPANANQAKNTEINLVSCDPEDYENSNIKASDVVTMVANQPDSPDGIKSALVLYSTRSNHCNVTGIDSLPSINGIFTTIDPAVIAQVVARNFSESSDATALVTPDRTSFTSYPGGSSGGFGQGPTTAIAMIILYSITGIITALFILIIITGAIRAHRHPERYGPRNGVGRPRQSRAKGIARAMLETLPIVKFGDHQNLPKETKASGADVEMADRETSQVSETSQPVDKSAATATTTDISGAEAPASRSSNDGTAAKNADGSDEAGSLGCSICTEDFRKGEEVRVLPCNHKFHPECVDPWLLNVSGTCPLCRISLAPQNGEGDNATVDAAPPLSPFTDRRSQAIHDLMSIAYGSREERITALRRHRAERRNRNSTIVNEEERISRTRRLREALRITTRTHGTNDGDRQSRRSGVDAVAAPQQGS